MKIIMKFVFVLLFVIGIGHGINAKYTNFNIVSGGNSFTRDYRVNTKTNTVKKSYVIWKKSNKKNHKQWFRVVDGNGKIKLSMRLSNVSTKAVSGKSTTENKKKYYIESKRENLFDPATTVSGTWQP